MFKNLKKGAKNPNKTKQKTGKKKSLKQIPPPPKKKKNYNMNTIKCAIKPVTVDSFLMNIATRSTSREKI